MVKIFNKVTLKEKTVSQPAWELMQQWVDAENWEEVGSGRKTKELPAEVKAVIEGKKETKSKGKKAAEKVEELPAETATSEEKTEEPAIEKTETNTVSNDPNQL